MRIDEGTKHVPGASLRYRLVCGNGNASRNGNGSGAPGNARPLFVFENGWGTSYHYWAWVQRELAPHADLLFYNRAGIGGSTLTAPRSALATSQQLDALLTALGFTGTALIVGQSYGGIMCALHAAQIPHRVRGLVQVDSTSERPHPQIDRTLGAVRIVTRVTMLIARLGLRDPLYGPAADLLPPEDGRQVLQTSFGSVESLRQALDELDMIGEYRAAIARGAAKPPRLVISAGAVTEMKGLRRFLASPEKARAILKVMEDEHKVAAANNNGRWMSLPYTHGDLVFREAGARATAAQVLEFSRSQP